MAFAVGQSSVGSTPVLVGSAPNVRRAVVTTIGGAGVFIGPTNAVSASTGFFLGSGTTDVEHPLVIDLQIGDEVWAVAADPTEAQTVFFLAYVPQSGA